MESVVIPAARLPRRRISRTTAKRLDRLARAAHRFHRFAHHPLCERYAGEVVRVGRVRLCRGCTYAIAGGLAGGCVGLVVGASIVVAAGATIAGCAMLMSTMYARGRPSKLVTRLVPAGLFALAMTCGVLRASVLGLVVAFADGAIVVGLRLLYGRRGADRTPCTTCPERELSPCSGFRAIVSRERAVQRVARSIILR
jgi:hypothetical protein